MAFVFRATKQTLTNPDNNSDIGPGLYISPDYYNKNISQNKVPFQTSVFRDLQTSKNESAVGPGSYYKDDRYENFLKMINKESEKKKNPLYRSIDIDKQTPFRFYLAEDLRQKSGFLSKDRRFRPQSIDLDGPGPGSYNSDKKIQKSPTMARVKPFKNLVDEQISELVGSPKRITSIPTKKQGYGYEVKGDSVVRMNDNPDKGKILSGMKNDCAGPGQYEIAYPDYWVKQKGTQWSKYKAAKSQTYTSANKSTAANTNAEDFEFFNERRLKEELNKENRKLEKLKMQQLFKEQGRRRRSLANEFHGSPNTSLLEKYANQNSPGPGYYIDIYDHSAFKKDPVPEKLQKFGSGSHRFIPSHVTIEGSVGPGAYFVDDINSRKMKQMNEKAKISPPFMSSGKRSDQKSVDLNPGPASYNIELKKSVPENPKCIFGSSEIRLPEKKITMKSPGPGSYIPLEKWNKITTNDVLKMMKPKFQENVKVFEEKDKDQGVPPVGAYKNDYINSINYKIEKKNSKFNSVNAPFLSINKRFKFKSENDELGPGKYEIEKKLGKINDMEFHPPFLQSDNRFKYDKNLTANGPGAYNQDSYFNWNKKSFNILYYS